MRKVIRLFTDYYKTASMAICRSIHGEGLKILPPKQMFQELPIAYEQLQTSNTSENLLLHEVRQVICYLYQEKEVTKNTRT